jgi:hypothetical protein
MLTLSTFEDSINPTILERGRTYFKGKAVTSLEEDTAGAWSATVEGSEDYEVEVVLSGENILSLNCDCPYDGGPVCKHKVAVLFALRAQKGKPASASKKPATLDFEAILLKAELEELRTFIRFQNQQDCTFGDKFMLYFAEKDPRIDLREKYTKLVRKIIKSNSKRGYMDYDATHEFSDDIETVIQAAETAILRNKYHEALTIGQVLCDEVFPVMRECDDSAGHVGDVVSAGIDILSSCVDVELSADLQLQLFQYLEKALADSTWFDYGNYGYELLEVGEKLALNSDPSPYISLLETLLKKTLSSFSDYRKTYFIKKQISLYEKIGREKDAQAIILANMYIAEIREMQVEKAIETKDFVKAKQLVKAGIQIAESKSDSGGLSKWEKILLKIAQAENDTNTVRHYAKKFALGYRIDLDYYQIWKATYPPAEWAKVIEMHIQLLAKEEYSKPRNPGWGSSANAMYERLSPIFIQEKDWAGLMKIVPENASQHILEQVHPYLAKTHPNEMLALYLSAFEKMGEQAYTRPEYEKLSSRMLKVKKDIAIGRTAIDELAQRLIQENPRRPAMKEELKKVLKA